MTDKITVRFKDFVEFKQSCKLSLDDMELSQSQIALWIEAIKETIDKHNRCIINKEHYTGTSCPLCNVAIKLNDLYDQTDDDICAYCPWSLVDLNLDDDNPYHYEEQSTCQDIDLVIARLPWSYKNNVLSIRRLDCWLDLLYDIYIFPKEES